MTKLPPAAAEADTLREEVTAIHTTPISLTLPAALSGATRPPATSAGRGAAGGGQVRASGSDGDGDHGVEPAGAGRAASSGRLLDVKG